MITHKICDHSDHQHYPNESSDKELIEAIKALILAQANLCLRMKDFFMITCYTNEEAYKSDVELLIKSNFTEKLDIYEKLRKIGAIGTSDAIYKNLDDAFDRIKKHSCYRPKYITGGI